jgi:folate-binding protein YgfZ
MNESLPADPFTALAALRIHGPQAVSFLQGQLSNDLTRLTREHPMLAGYHNPQGRVIALMRLVLRAPGDILAVMPGELLAPVASRLRRYILRSRVTIDAAANATAEELGEASRRVNVCAGQPQVYAATSEQFIAQMLNFDLIGAIAFDKGCYTGQEVIARAHYRGRVKRRMQRFLTVAPASLRPGDAGQLSDGRGFKVVEVAAHPDGRCEFLAVAALVPRNEASADEDAEGALAKVDAVSLPLPYELPA